MIKQKLQENKFIIAALVAGILIGLGGNWVYKKTSLNSCLSDTNSRYLMAWDRICDSYKEEKNCILTPTHSTILDFFHESLKKKCSIENDI